MSDIFISFEKSDLAKAEMLAKALTEQGWSVFLDRTIRNGTDWYKEIVKELKSARCIIVLWSKASIESHWVRAEAKEGQDREILVPLLIDDMPMPPFGFEHIQTGNLANWEGAKSDNPYRKLINDLSTLLEPPPPLPVWITCRDEDRFWRNMLVQTMRNEMRDVARTSDRFETVPGVPLQHCHTLLVLVEPREAAGDDRMKSEIEQAKRLRKRIVLAMVSWRGAEKAVDERLRELGFDPVETKAVSLPRLGPTRLKVDELKQFLLT